MSLSVCSTLYSFFSPSHTHTQNNPNLLNNLGGNNPNLGALGNMQPLQAQKYLNQNLGGLGGGVGHGGIGGVAGFNQGGGVGLGGVGGGVGLGGNGGVGGNPSQPSTQQLRMLVQQIQMAVQAGYLNHQILNQPLAPTTLILLNQLLTNIKVSTLDTSASIIHISHQNSPILHCFSFANIHHYLLHSKMRISS